MKKLRSIAAFVILSCLSMLSVATLSLAAPTTDCANPNVPEAGNPSCIPKVGGIIDRDIQSENTAIINGILAITGSFALLFLIIGGFRYVMSQGDEKKVESAKAIIKAAIFGLIIILLAWVILRVIESFIRGSI